MAFSFPRVTRLADGALTGRRVRARACAEASSLLMNLKRDAQVPVAVALRTAVWNWIELFPDEYNDALRYHRRLDGAPERVFDLLYDAQDATRDKGAMWPTLAVLLCISHDRMKGEFEANALGGLKGPYRKVRYGGVSLAAGPVRVW